MSWTVIVPTYAAREKEFTKFITLWKPYFKRHNAQLVVMFDGESAASWAMSPEWTTLSWADIKAKHIPRKTDMVRSWAMYWAYKNTESDYFLTLDDDVLPVLGDDLFTEYEKVFAAGAPLSEYFDVGLLTSSDQQMRGFPYKDRKKRPVAVQYGGWRNVLDYDAATQISQQPEHETFEPAVVHLPKGCAATCCIMNCAWQRKYTPIMWQLPMLDGRYNRVGDIWSGLFIKKTLDSVGAVMVINGAASGFHDRASNVYESLKKEAPSVWLNDNLWHALNMGITNADSMLEYYEAYTDLAIKFFMEHDKEYAKHFQAARDEWLALWDYKC